MHISSANITIQGLSLLHGRADDGQNGGCILISGDNAVIKDCNISGCIATWGGGIWVSEAIGSTTILDRVVISRCTAERGGGIGVASNLRIREHFWSFENEASLVGGALYLHLEEGKVIFESGQPALFERNSAWFAGGGIFLYDGSFLVAQRPMLFSENSAYLYGGAISVQSSHLDVQDVEFYSNVVWSQGGAICLKSKPDVLPTTVTFHGDAIFVSNRAIGDGNADGYGGAIKAEGTPQLPATLEFRKSLQMRDNSARFGGALYTYASTNITVSVLSASRNTGLLGGAVSLRHSEMHVLSGGLDNNVARRGGAFYVTNSILTAAGCALVENSAMDQGGALAILESAVALRNTRLERNRAIASGLLPELEDYVCKPGDPCGGGAVFVSGSSELDVSDAVLTGNAAPGFDGGAVLACGQARVSLTQSRIQNNSAGANGGGVAALDQSTLAVSDTLLLHNRAAAEGGAVFARCAGATLASSSVGNNQAGSNGAGISTYSGLVLRGGSIFRDNAAAGSGGAIFASGHRAQLIVGPDGALEVANNSAGRSGGGAALQLSAAFRVEFNSCPKTCATWRRGNGVCETDW